jgi:hypothetical protein
MWLIVALAASLVASAGYLLLKKERKKLRLGFLALMLWGVAIMIFVDHAVSYLEGGSFMQATTGGLVTNSFVLGILMLAPVLLIWAFAAFTPLGKKLFPE